MKKRSAPVGVIIFAVKSVMRGVITVFVSVLAFAPSVSAASTVITAQVAPVRHVVVDSDGVIQEVVSNTAENVLPLVHLGSMDGTQIPLSDDVRQQYVAIISQLDMHRTGYVYTAQEQWGLSAFNLQLVSLLPLVF